MAAYKRQHGPGEQSNLLLYDHIRPGRALGVPAADWTRIVARGFRVARAKQTMAAKGMRVSPLNRPGSKTHIFSNTLPKNRKHGWRMMDLIRHAHVCEIELVRATEARLEPLRKRVAGLTSTGTRFLQALYQHKRALDIETEKGVTSNAVEPPSSVIQTRIRLRSGRVLTPPWRMQTTTRSIPTNLHSFAGHAFKRSTYREALIYVPILHDTRPYGAKVHHS